MTDTYDILYDVFGKARCRCTFNGRRCTLMEHGGPCYFDVFDEKNIEELAQVWAENHRIKAIPIGVSVQTVIASFIRDAYVAGALAEKLGKHKK